METTVRDAKIKPLMDGMEPVNETKQEMVDEEEGGVDMDAELVLLPGNGDGGIPKRNAETKRKVDWNDYNGHLLAQVLEFVPSDVSDTDDEDADTCFCTIM